MSTHTTYSTAAVAAMAVLREVADPKVIAAVEALAGSGETPVLVVTIPARTEVDEIVAEVMA